MNEKSWNHTHTNANDNFKVILNYSMYNSLKYEITELANIMIIYKPLSWLVKSHFQPSCMNVEIILTSETI